MLHQSFKPAKCETALKLAVSRIKLLKNKSDAQIRQLKRELVQLLESGHELTARIRVEHLVREEKTLAAYDLVEIYCELIVARFPIIESQKDCPIDLKEAITSVIFAFTRCAYIPELIDVLKHFTAKYGKELISSAVELHPDCGVSRPLVEKLSDKAPDGETKIKILSAIAEEHNIKWDPKSFGEKDAKPPENLLNGPNTFEKASKMNVEPPNMQYPPNCDRKHDVPINLYEHNVRSALNSQNFASTDIGASKTTTSGTSHPEARPSGTGVDDYDVVSNSNCQKFRNDAVIIFDESSSDDDECWFDAESDLNGQESNLYFTSPGRKSPTHLSANTNTWSCRQTMSESLGKSIQHSHFSAEGRSPPKFSESLTKSAVRSQPDGLLPVTFDDSDDPSSESQQSMQSSRRSLLHEVKDNVHATESPDTTKDTEF